MPRLKPTGLVASIVPEPGPQRVYGLAMLVNTFGFGLILTSMTLYFTRIVHLSPGSVGFGMTIAGLFGLLAGMPIGDLADRRGPREVVMAAMLVQCLAAVGYVFIHDFAGFMIVYTLEVLSLSAFEAARSPLMRRVGGEDAAAFRASTQAIANLGISLGAVGCGVALAIGTPIAYRSLFVANALTFLGGWAVLRRLPHYEPLPKPESGPRWAALTDKPFAAYSVVAGAMVMQYFVIMLSLPLWVVDHTHAPRWSVSLYLLVNTVLVVLFQVRVARHVKTVRQGGSAMLTAGVAFLFSCSMIGLAAGLPSWAALLLLIAAVMVHTAGELWYSSGTFALGFGLPPAHAQGQYQGLAGIGTGAGQAAAPIILIGLCLSLGRAGWIGLGVCFALLGLTAPAIAEWGERTRPLPAPVSETEPVRTAD
jgi:MFS family permease